MKKNILKRLFSFSLVFFSFTLLVLSTAVTKTSVVSNGNEAQAFAVSSGVDVGNDSFLHQNGLETYDEVVNDYLAAFRAHTGTDLGGVYYFPGFIYMDCKNSSQSVLRSYYNQVYKNGQTNYNGVCAQVAVSMATDLIIRNTQNRTVDMNEIFVKSMDYSINNNYFDITQNLTNSGYIDEIWNYTLNYYGISRSIYHTSANLYSTLKNGVVNGTPAILSMVDHATVAVGYQEYSFNYTVKHTQTILWWTNTWYTEETFSRNYIALLTGWYDTSMIYSGQSSQAEADAVLTYVSEEVINQAGNQGKVDIVYIA